VTIYY